MKQDPSKNTTLNKRTVLFSVKGDVTGDNVLDTVNISGLKTAESAFIQDIVLSVKNGKTGKTTSINLTNNQGYEPTLFLGDFTGDGVKDILVQIDSGGSGAITYDYIYSFAGKAPALIFDSDAYNEAYNYKINYENYYLVNAVSENNLKKYIIDITYKDKSYLREIYDSNGILKQPVEGFVNPLSSMFPVDIDRDGVYELMAFQKIAGQYNADSLGYFENVLKYEDNKFNLFMQYLNIFGEDL